MASVNANEIPDIQKFFTEFWSLVKKYWVIEPSNDKYFDDLVAEMCHLHDRYPSAFCSEILLGYDRYLTRVTSEMKKNDERTHTVREKYYKIDFNIVDITTCPPNESESKIG